MHGRLLMMGRLGHANLAAISSAVLDGPVTAVDAQQLGGAGLGGGAAGHAQVHFNALTA